MRHKRTGQDERTPEGEGSDYVADTKNGLVVTKAEGVWGQSETGKEVSCMVMDGN